MIAASSFSELKFENWKPSLRPRIAADVLVRCMASLLYPQGYVQGWCKFLSNFFKPKDTLCILSWQPPWASMWYLLIYVELGWVPFASPPVFTASCGLSKSRNVKSWSETQSHLIPSSLRPSSLNTLSTLCCWGQLFVFPQLLSEISHNSHQREPCFPAVMHYGP